MRLSVSKCSVWLKAFLQCRGMQETDQRGLFEYQCSFEEYADLQRLLRELGSFDAAIKDAAACAALVLFCSEWYRREYLRDHGWSWEPIFQALGFSLSPVDLSRAIPRGLEGFWKRPIHFYESERRDFLGSVFSGGLAGIGRAAVGSKLCLTGCSGSMTSGTWWATARINRWSSSWKRLICLKCLPHGLQ